MSNATEVKQDNDFTTASGENFERFLREVKVEQISLNDPFLNYEPKTGNQKRVKMSILRAKKTGMKNFYHAIIDPSYTFNKEGIEFKESKVPAYYGEFPAWWDTTFENLLPNRESRIGSKTQYDVFLGTIVKFLVEEKGYKIPEAWYMVCDNNDYLVKHVLGMRCYLINMFKTGLTGSMSIDGWCDLFNTSKILKTDNGEEFLIAVNSENERVCVADIVRLDSEKITMGVGWLVVNKK